MCLEIIVVSYWTERSRVSFFFCTYCTNHGSFVLFVFWVEYTKGIARAALASLMVNFTPRIILGPDERLFNWVFRDSLNY